MSSRRTLLFLIPLAAALIVGLGLAAGKYRPQAGQVAAATWAAPPLPDTPAGRQLDSFLEVFNGGDEQALKAFVAKQFTPLGPGGSDLASRTASQLQLYQTSRGLDLYEIAESRDDAITVSARFRLTQQWRRITMMVEDGPLHRISGIRIAPIDPPVIAAAVPVSEKDLWQQIDNYVKNLVAADQFSGVVLVAKDGEPLWERAYAMADRERGIANDPATRFSFASLGKMFTAVAVAQLAAEGKLAYEDPLATHLSDYPADVARQVTIDHLLTHRSGIIDFFADSERFNAVKDSSDPQRDYLGLFMNEPLRFVPGERFEYSNSNYILLGAIIERVSGLAYETYLQQRVFAPAGMSQTSLSTEGIDAKRLAKGYTQLDDHQRLGSGPRRLATGLQTAVGSAAGGGNTTVGDLLKFDRALRSHRLLTAAATEQLLLDRVDYPRPGYRYGYGFIFRQAGPHRIAGHSGGFPGVDAQFEMYLDSGYSVIVLSNYEQVGEPIAMQIQQLLSRTTLAAQRSVP